MKKKLFNQRRFNEKNNCLTDVGSIKKVIIEPMSVRFKIKSLNRRRFYSHFVKKISNINKLMPEKVQISN